MQFPDLRGNHRSAAYPVPHEIVAVAMGTEPVQLPAGSVLLSAAPLGEDGWLQPNNPAWVLRD